MPDRPAVRMHLPLDAGRAAIYAERHFAIRRYMNDHGVGSREATAAVDQALAEAFHAAFASMREAFQQVGEAFAGWLGAQVREIARRHPDLFEEPSSVDPQERALAARRSRNTGPALPGMDGRRR